VDGGRERASPSTRVVSFIILVFCLRFEDETREEPMKVLVVEAEDAVLKVTGVMLNKLGYEVGLALNCNEAFRIYCDNGPHDLVVIALKFLRSSRAGVRNLLMLCGRRIPNKSSRLSLHRRF
jgi:hypothetical protein